MNPRRFQLLITPACVLALLFPVMAFDVVARLLGSSARLDTANVTLLLFYETTRAVWAIAALLLAAFVIVRANRRRDFQALATSIVFATIAYGMFSAGSYPGHFQERMVRSLLDLGLNQSTIAALFALGLWPFTLAVGAFIRFSVLFPAPLTPATVHASGAHDRRGALRSVPGAGVDIGAVFRGIVARGLEHGWFGARVIAATSAAFAVFAIALRNSAGVYALWLAVAFGIAVAITALRATWSTGDPVVRLRLARLGRGALASLVCFATAGILGGVIRSQAGAVLVVILMTLAPAPLLAGLAAAVLTGGVSAKQTANREVGDEMELDAVATDRGRGAGRGAGTAGRIE